MFSKTENPIATNPDDNSKTIHVFVALCDNKYQGIVPVPAKIGNGQDIDNNLYWGCGFGIRSYFKKSKQWKYIGKRKKQGVILERIIFKHATKNYYLVADAYDGKYIKQCTIDYLNASCGKKQDTIHVGAKTIGISGNSDMLAYIGHDGLMDFDLENDFSNTDRKKRDLIILACASKQYFTPQLKKANVNPMVWTTNLMCPEAYTLHDALDGYVIGEKNEQVRSRAAASYSKFQKCSLKAARGLLVTGF
ncbi:MAG: hypothetical protein EOO50_05655 [Flavobacterium sp.]|nr:MAG: hypothetical protein EOO50_05655 [Flavobacterium sp.]